MKKRLLLIILLFIFSVTSANAADKLSVFVSIVPQKYFVQQIGKDLVDIKIMVKPGASPATYEPKPRQMAELSKAKLYFSIGVPFENAWLKKISSANPNMKVIHTDHGIEKIAMAEHHHDEDEHHDEKHEDGHHDGEHHDEKDHHDGDHEGEHHDEKAHKDDDHHDEDQHGEETHEDDDHHDHTGLDPHIWTAPALVKIQATAMLKALKQTAPQHKKEFEANYNAFMAQIDALDQDLKQTLAGTSGTQFMVFHPSWGYFAQEYGLKQVPIEIEGKDPKPAQLKELIKHAKKDGIKVIFVQPQFSSKSAKLVAREIGGQVAYADPLAEDWMKNLRMIAQQFKAVLK
ncbi:metal ABC transporter solute-binding protein, Zn/Mn family [Desulfobacula sp.]|uniref:metal ABC transporter solute-binding protein, Zn/Mn family n=1 Tax=Desulfobacula sp. TaxID=2593537 RepID=UPI001EC0DE72|nr:zinc ABC transporter substrate-binding protein [Desulfobacula sp.]